RGKGNIGPEIEEALMSDRFKKVVIVGGTGAINAAVETRLQEAGKQVVRLAGGNRFETALNVARWELGMDAEAAFQPEVEMKADGMGIATGMDFADALGSVSLLGKTKSVLALTLNPAGARQLVTNMVNELIVPNVPVMEKGYIFGGTGAVSEEIEALLNEAVQ
ncbi:MAG: cell wall-binding repeat-containing protein, partial [Lachnospiraceae bacterium]|nr:cell wall-binding repeat-containing protein [Lachnospiraceae bacterium]